MAERRVTPEDVEHADRAVRDLDVGVAARLRELIPRREEPRVSRAEDEQGRLRGTVEVVDRTTSDLVAVGITLERGLPTVQATEHKRQALDGQIADRLDERTKHQYAEEVALIRGLSDQSIAEMKAAHPDKAKALMDEAEAKLNGLIEIAALEKRLVEANAPEELSQAVRASFQDYGLSEKRIERLVELAEFFIANKQIITPDSEVNAGVIEIAQALKGQIEKAQEFTDEHDELVQTAMQQLSGGVKILRQQKLAGIDEMIEQMEDMGSQEGAPDFIQGMYAKIKQIRSDVEAGKETDFAELELYGYLLSQYGDADAALRKKIAGWSADLVAERKDEATVRREIRDYLIAEINSQTLQIAGGFPAGQKAMASLETAEATLQQIYFATGLRNAVERYLKGYTKISGEPLEQLNGIYEKIFAAVSAGDLTQFQLQIELSQLYVDKRITPEKRVQIHEVSLKASERPQETAGYVEIAKAQLAIVEMQQNAKHQKKPVVISDLYYRPIKYMDRLLGKLAAGEQLTEQETTAYRRMQTLYFGTGQDIAGLIAGTDGIHTLDQTLRTLGNAYDITKGLKGVPLFGTVDILQSAQDAIEENRSEEEFATYLIAANAYSKADERGATLILHSVVEITEQHIPIEQASWIVQTELKRQEGLKGVKDSGIKRNIQAYYDAAHVLFLRGDKGADKVRELADLYCRAAKQPNTEKIVEFVRTVLGDYRRGIQSNRILDMLREEGDKFTPTTLPGPLGAVLVSGTKFIDVINKSEDEKLVALFPASDTERVTALDDREQQYDHALREFEFQVVSSRIIGATASEQRRIAAVYTAQRAFHEQKRSRAETARRALEVGIQSEEAERINHVRIRTMLEKFDSSYTRGIELIEQAQALRIGAEGTPKSEKIQEADRLEQQGLRLIYLAEQGQKALGELHSSITTVRTIHRYSGREEYDKAAQTFLELSTVDSPQFDEQQRRTLVGATYAMLGGGMRVERERQIQHTVAALVRNIKTEEQRIQELDKEHGNGSKNGPVTTAVAIEHGGTIIERGTPLLETQTRLQELGRARAYARGERFVQAQRTLRGVILGIQLDIRKIDVHQQHSGLLEMAVPGEIEDGVLKTEVRMAQDGAEVVVGFDYRGLMAEIYDMEMNKAAGHLNDVELRLTTFPKRTEFARRSQLLLFERGAFERQADRLMGEYVDTVDGRYVKPEELERTQRSREAMASGAANLAAELDVAAGKVDDTIDGLVNGNSTPVAIEGQLESVRIQLEQFTANQPLMIRRMYQKTGLEVNAERLTDMGDRVERTYGTEKEGEIGPEIVRHANDVRDNAYQVRKNVDTVVGLVDDDIAELSRGGVGSRELDDKIEDVNQYFVNFGSVYSVAMQRLGQMEHLREREVELRKLEQQVSEFGTPQKLPEPKEEEQIDYAGLRAHQQVLDAVRATGLPSALVRNAGEVREDTVQTARVLGTNIDMMLVEEQVDEFKPEYTRGLILGVYHATNGSRGEWHEGLRRRKGDQAAYESLMGEPELLRKGLEYLWENDEIRPGLHAQLTADLEFRRIGARLDQFNAGAQLAMGCLEDSVILFDTVDQYERTHGYGGGKGTYHSVMRSWAARLLQIGIAAASDPEGVTRSIIAGGRVSLPEIKQKIREYDGVYNDAIMSTGTRREMIASELQGSMFGFLETMQSFSVGSRVSMRKNYERVEQGLPIILDHLESRKMAQLYETATLAKMGIAETEEGYVQVDLSKGEHEMVLAHAAGSKDVMGVTQLLGKYFDVGLGLTTIWSEEERRQMYAAIAVHSDHNLEVINGVVQNRLAGGEPASEESITRIYTDTSHIAWDFKVAYSNLEREGQETESTARGIQAGTELVGAIALTATGFGAGVGVAFGTKALYQLSEDSRRAGGFSQLTTTQQILGVGGVALGFGGAALGELSAIANESLAVGRVTTFSSLMGAGGRGITVLGGGLMVGGLGMAGYGAYESGKAYIDGHIGLLEFTTTGALGLMQAVAPLGSSVLPTRSARAWKVAGTTQDTTSARVFRTVMTGLTGETVETVRLAETNAMRAQLGRKYSELGETHKTMYSQLELRLGRVLSPEEGLAFIERLPTRKVGKRTVFVPLGIAATEKILAEAEAHFRNPTETKPPEQMPPQTKRDQSDEMRERAWRAKERFLQTELESNFTSMSVDGEGVKRYTLGRGETAENYSSKHVEAAVRIVNGAEKILSRNPEFGRLTIEERRAVVAEILGGHPEEIQMHAMELASNPEYLSNRINRAKQLEFGLEAAIKLPEIAREAEAIAIRARTEEEHLQRNPGTVENLRERIQNRQFDATKLREEANAGKQRRAEQLEKLAAGIERGTERLSEKLRSLEPALQEDTGFSERKRVITEIEVEIEGQKSQPWNEVTEAERAQVWPEIKRLYDEAYGAADLHYTDPERLFRGSTPIWFVARNEAGRIVGFATASKTPRGELRVGLFGGSQEPQLQGYGRAAVRALVRRLTTTEDSYALVSGRPAHLALKYEGEFTQFAEVKAAMGDGAQRGELSPTKPAKNLNALRKMGGFETSEIVIEAATRTGKPVGEIVFEDLVEQAVIRGEIPPEGRAHCFAVSQDIGGKKTIIIKLMIGHPKRDNVVQIRVAEAVEVPVRMAVGAEDVGVVDVQPVRTTAREKPVGMRTPVLELKESVEAANAVRAAPVEELITPTIINEHILHRAGLEMVDGQWQRTGVPEWLVGEEVVAGESVTIGMIVRSVEEHVVSQAIAGREMDVVVIRSDKKALTPISRMFGQEGGDDALAVSHDIISGAVKRVIGDSQDQAVYLMRPQKGKGDESIGIIIVPKGKGEEIRARLADEMETVTDAEYQTATEGSGRLRYAFALMRRPHQLIESGLDVSRPVTVGRRDGRVVALHADGNDAMVQRRDGRTGFLEAQITRTEEEGSLSFAPALRERLGVKTTVGWRLSTDIQDLAQGERVSGTAFEIRLRVDDSQAYVDMGGRVPGVKRTERTSYLERTGKGYAEIEKNALGLSGINTYLTHDGADYLVTTIEAAIGRHAREHGVTIRRLGTMKYVLEGGSLADVVLVTKFIDEQLHSEGVKMSTTTNPARVVNAIHTEALATISNGRLKLVWGSENYDAADAILSAMTIGNDEILGRLGLDKLRDITEVVRRNPQIRKVEDLLLKFRKMLEPNGSEMARTFVEFVLEEGAAFETRRQIITRSQDRLALVPIQDNVPEIAPRPAEPPKALEVTIEERSVALMYESDAVFGVLQDVPNGATTADIIHTARTKNPNAEYIVYQDGDGNVAIVPGPKASKEREGSLLSDGFLHYCTVKKDDPNSASRSNDQITIKGTTVDEAMRLIGEWDRLYPQLKEFLQHTKAGIITLPPHEILAEMRRHGFDPLAVTECLERIGIRLQIGERGQFLERVFGDLELKTSDPDDLQFELPERDFRYDAKVDRAKLETMLGAKINDVELLGRGAFSIAFKLTLETGQEKVFKVSWEIGSEAQTEALRIKLFGEGRTVQAERDGNVVYSVEDFVRGNGTSNIKSDEFLRANGLDNPQGREKVLDAFARAFAQDVILGSLDDAGLQNYNIEMDNGTVRIVRFDSSDGLSYDIDRTYNENGVPVRAERRKQMGGSNDPMEFVARLDPHYKESGYTKYSAEFSDRVIEYIDQYMQRIRTEGLIEPDSATPLLPVAQTTREVHYDQAVVDGFVSRAREYLTWGQMPFSIEYAQLQKQIKIIWLYERYQRTLESGAQLPADAAAFGIELRHVHDMRKTGNVGTGPDEMMRLAQMAVERKGEESESVAKDILESNGVHKNFTMQQNLGRLIEGIDSASSQRRALGHGDGLYVHVDRYDRVVGVTGSGEQPKGARVFEFGFDTSTGRLTLVSKENTPPMIQIMDGIEIPREVHYIH